MKSCLYEGWVRHRRYGPRPHAFRYRLFMLWLDLDELDHVFAGRWLWSMNSKNLAAFFRRDHLGDPNRALGEAVRDEVEMKTGHRPLGPICLLTHPRYFGYGFNPVSFYYCYAEDGETLDTLVAEVRNTPWKERHVYVLPMHESSGRPDRPAFRSAKEFHVSPFLPMNLEYHWRFNLPGRTLCAHIEDHEGEARVFDATLSLRRRALNGTSLARALIRFPFMTGQVVLGIYWQALRLWLKGAPIHDHPQSELKFTEPA
ncbi:MAG: DUF1365 domain-containing protein [Betaproteobacteria bacterium]|nr:DUF1365 domain-containing protein [Betaproteobacteria bacterium]